MCSSAGGGGVARTGMRRVTRSAAEQRKRGSGLLTGAGTVSPAISQGQRRRLRHDFDPITPALFSAIEGGVRSMKHLARVGTILRKNRYAHRDRHGTQELLTLKDPKLANRFVDQVRFHFRVLERHLRQDQGELFSPVTAGDVFGSGVALQERRD